MSRPSFRSLRSSSTSPPTPVNPFAVQGEVVVGAVVPAAVTLYQVPGSVYGYTIINHNKVLVDVNTRAVVYIHRV